MLVYQARWNLKCILPREADELFSLVNPSALEKLPANGTLTVKFELAYSDLQ